MADWNEKENCLEIKSVSGESGFKFLSVGLMISVLAMFSGRQILHIFLGENIGFVQFLVFSLSIFGVSCVLLGFARNKMVFVSSLRLDLLKNSIAYRKDDKLFCNIRLSAYVDILLLTKQKKTLRDFFKKSEPTFKEYHIFLAKQGGGHFWIDSFREEPLFLQRAKQLHQFLGFEVHDQTGLLGNIEGIPKEERSYSESELMHEERKFFNLDRRAFARVEHRLEGTDIVLKRNRSPIDKAFILILTLLFFVGPLGIGILSYQRLFSAEVIGFEIILTASILTFCLLFYFTCLSFIYLVYLRKYVIQLRSDKLIVRSILLISALDKFFSRVIVFNKNFIQGIQIHRMVHGHVCLALVVENSFNPVQVDRATSFLLDFGSFGQDELDTFPFEGRQISLWRVESWRGLGESASFQDLMNIEDAIESHFSLQTRKLGETSTF